jgi:hypothetical protein
MEKAPTVFILLTVPHGSMHRNLKLSFAAPKNYDATPNLTTPK